ncbi:MAG: SWF/SNF helicase family protein [Candidatus Cloacimonetes bacterium]|nr:SWF/SNF helicase family protein [Candidatus Cloacimonadota bacterium]
MVKRFESSFGSFEQSIKNFKKITKIVLEFIEKTNKYILDRSLLEKIYSEDIEKIEKYLKDYSEKIRSGDYPKNHKIYKVEEFKYKDDFIAHINVDLILFDKILKELSNLDLVKNDPKTDCLIINIKKILKQKPNYGEPKRKLIIFSEYLDTVKYLKPVIEKHFGKKLLVVAGNLSINKISEINKNFDAISENQENEYDILLSTDKISEGFNLNRAGMVINYDIPWNPVRVIQRVGRINRISKKVFDELNIVNFFPTEKGSELVKSREIAGNKMFLIHSTLGEDSKIFDIDEEPSPSGLFERIQQNPDNFEEESFYTKALKKFLEIKGKYPKLIEEIKKFPPRIKTAKIFDENELLVFFKKGRLYIHGIKQDENDQVYSATFEDVFDKIICNKDEPKMALSNQFWGSYEKVKKHRESRYVPVSEQSIEQKALNNLKSFISKPWAELIPHLDFLRILREDILDYGTLSDYTMRRIANLESSNETMQKKSVLEIIKIKQELGEDYLQKEKERQKYLLKEIIIAIENRKL